MYRRHAAGYDATTRRTEPNRRRTIARLRLAAGDTVVDVACGTGLSFPILRDAVGPSGRVIGIEQSPEMAALARRRVAASGWENVELIEYAAEEARIPAPFDAVLFHFAHDVLRSSAALENVFAAARPGARVAAAGMKYLPWWAAPANLYILFKAYPYAANLEGLGRPWSLLQERYAPDLEVESVFWGGGYIAHGTYCPVISYDHHPPAK
jgi:arsenite methyltransferase